MCSISFASKAAALASAAALWPVALAAQTATEPQAQVQVLGPLYALGPPPVESRGRQRRVFQPRGYWQPPVFVPYRDGRQQGYGPSPWNGYAAGSRSNYTSRWWYRRPGYGAYPPPRFAARVYTPRWQTARPEPMATAGPLLRY